jgi:hypothetical protein
MILREGEEYETLCNRYARIKAEHANAGSSRLKASLQFRPPPMVAGCDFPVKCLWNFPSKSLEISSEYFSASVTHLIAWLSPVNWVDDVSGRTSDFGRKCAPFQS